MTKALMTEEEHVWEFMDDRSSVAVVVADQAGDLYLIYPAGVYGDELAFQGVPIATNENSTEGDPNCGYVGVLLSRGPLAKVWPVLS